MNPLRGLKEGDEIQVTARFYIEFSKILEKMDLVQLYDILEKTGKKTSEYKYLSKMYPASHTSLCALEDLSLLICLLSSYFYPVQEQLDTIITKYVKVTKCRKKK